MLGIIGPLEIGVVALVVLGLKRLPKLDSGLGTGMHEFKGSISADREPWEGGNAGDKSSYVAKSQRSQPGRKSAG